MVRRKLLFALVMIFSLLLGLSAGFARLTQAAPIPGIKANEVRLNLTKHTSDLHNTSSVQAALLSKRKQVLPPGVTPQRSLLQNTPVLTITKTADPDPVSAGRVLTYTIVVANSITDANGVVITDSLDSNVSYASSSDGGNHNAGVVTWNVGAITAGYTITRTLQVTVGNPASDTILTNTARLTSTEGVTATDTITTDVNLAPTDISLSSTSVAENQPSGTTVGTFSTTDPDTGDTHTYSLVLGSGSGDNDSFSIAGDSLKTNTVFNYVDKSSYNIRGRTTDAGDLSFEKVFTITVIDVTPEITLTKRASQSSIPETGGNVTFTIGVTNTSAETATLDSLIDTAFGNLHGAGDCTVPQTLASSGGSYSCSVMKFISGDFGGPAHQNTVTAAASDDENNPASETSTETVTFTDVTPAITLTKRASQSSVPETGGNVTFTIGVTNTSAETATLDSLIDTAFGNLHGAGDCAVPQTLAGSGGSYSCSVTKFISGDFGGPAHQNTVTAAASDDENNPASETSTETVTFTDVEPEITVMKTADVSSVPETGGNVTFTIGVTNTSAETATLDSLIDTAFGNLHGAGDCVANGTVTILPTETYSCSFTEFVSGNFGDSPHENTITAVASDDDGNSDTATGTETVAFTDIPSSISVNKKASPTQVPESGGSVVFTVVVTNTSSYDYVTITSLVDDQFGDVSSVCGLPRTLAPATAPGASFTCQFVRFIAGNPGDTHTNEITASGDDDDGIPVSANDSADVAITNQTSSITVIKTASPSRLDEPGGTVNFEVHINNLSLADSVTINSLTDSMYGNLDNKGNCQVPQDILPGGFYECTFSGEVSGNAYETKLNVVTARGVDDDGSPVENIGIAAVNIDDIEPDTMVTLTTNPTSVPETGGNVTYTVQVTNNTAEPNIGLTSLNDSDIGDLNGQGDCAVPQTLAGNGTYVCSFSQFISGDFGGPDHQNTVTAEVADDEGNSDTEQGDVTVSFTDVLPNISVTKTANPTSISEPGGNVTFTIFATNNSAEAAMLNALSDTDYGNLHGKGDCIVPQTLSANGGTYSCSFTEFISGKFSDPAHQNTVTVTASDDDGNSVFPNDDATVTFRELNRVYLPFLMKPAPTELFVHNDQTGGDVTFIVRDQTTNEEITRCTVGNGATIPCDHDGDGSNVFPPGEYNVEVVAVCGSDSFLKIYDSGPQTTRVFCN